MNELPIIISILFMLTTFATVWLFYNAAGKSKAFLKIILAWAFLQSIISMTGFYQVTDVFPPRFVLLIGPGIIFGISLLFFNAGRNFMDSLDIAKLTILHTIRIPVEICLYFVSVAGLIPVLMTIEGNNYDLISGITSPIVFFLFIKSRMNRSALLAWNILCLALLTNVLIIAILSAQTPFQKYAFDQPNIGVTYFPFVLLPSVIVPIVIVSHLSAIRQLVKGYRTRSVIFAKNETL